MKSKEFDQLVRRSFDDASLPYNPENWQKLSAALAENEEKEQKKRRFLLWPLASIAASVAMAIGIFAWMSQRNDATHVQANKKTKANTTQHIAVQEQTPVNSPVIAADAPVAEAPEHINETPRTQSPVPQKQQLPIAVQQQPEKVFERIDEQQVSPVVPQAPVVVKNVEPEPMIHRAEKETIVPEKKPVRSLAAITNPNTYYEDIKPVKRERKQYLTMAGGLNYGTLNSGYVMGFSAGTRLNERFYVESDVAFVGNIANEKNQKTTFMSKPANPYAKTTSAASSYASTVTVQRFYNLYYAQLTPTVGYKLARKMSVGVGADVQRLLINQQLITETDNPADSRELPVYDMGLVGKTEYSLTREIKASVYYRKGMNQALQSNSKMLDRDYLQLQLKFNILNK